MPMLSGPRKYWHQLGQRPLTMLSRSVLRNILRIPRHSRWERHGNVLLVFFASGALHLVAERYVYSSPGQMQLAFFVSSAQGIAIEDWVSLLWFGPREQEDLADEKTKSGVAEARPLVRLAGFVWVVAWMSLTAPWILYPPSRLPVDECWLVPFSLARRVGLPLAQTGLGLAGLVLRYCVSGQV